MNLPIYQMIHVKNAGIEELLAILKEEANHRHPVVYVLKALSLDDQREAIGIIENWLETKNISWTYPYPIYFVSDFGETIGHVPVVQDTKMLPRFFNQKDHRLTVKDTQILDKNRLLQQEIRNTDPHMMKGFLQDYAAHHKVLWGLAREAEFYSHLIDRLKAKARG